MRGAVDAARRYVTQITNDQVFVKIDFKNAFNTVQRDAFIEAVAKHVPELLHFVLAAYSESNELHFNKLTIPSEEGAQQGDLLGPLLFCLAIHDLLLLLQSELVVGYLDDISLGGGADAVINNFMNIEAKATHIGLQLNRSKCISGLTSNTRANFIAHGIHLQETDLLELKLLGAPLLPGPGVDSTLAAKRHELETWSKRLKFIPTHDGTFLLCNILAMPRLLYTLRASPCTGSPELHRYDDQLKTSTLNIDVSPTVWEQASLPVSWGGGGFGKRSAALLAPSAYLASAAGVTNLILNLLPHRLHNTSDASVDMALSAWREQVEPTTSPRVTDQRSHQKAWDTPCCEWKAAALLAGAPDKTSRARLLASVQDTSGSWLSAVFISSLGLKLGDDAVRITAGLRLGVNLCELHVCLCRTQDDARGIHGLACKKSAGRHPRHSELNDIVWRALQRAQVPSTKEPVGLSRQTSGRPHPDTMGAWTLPCMEM